MSNNTLKSVLKKNETIDGPSFSGKNILASNFGECNFLKLNANLIAAFIDADMFEIKISLEGSEDKDNIVLYFGRTEKIQGRALGPRRRSPDQEIFHKSSPF